MGTAKAPLAGVIYRFAPFEVDTRRGELRKFDLRIRLERKPWLLLIALLERPRQLLTRAELQQALWPDGTFVDFEHGLNVAVKKLRGALCDSPESPRYIETVAGEGYRFIATVEQVVAAQHAESQPPVGLALVRPPATSVPRPWFRRKLPIAVAAAVLLAVLSFIVARPAWRLLRKGSRPISGKIMLVVLPFENLSGDPNQEYLSDGITEELSARLGNLNPQQLGVIGRTSAMTYKHIPRTIRQIGKELGVSYVLEGSVRRDDNKVRVTAQLVSAADQAHVWAEDYDLDMHGLLRVEDEVASDIARQIGITMAVRPQPSRPRHVPNPDAYEAYLVARYYLNKRTPEGWRKGYEYFRRAVQKDPEFAAAYAGLAVCGLHDSPQAVAAARKAVELDPGSAEAHTALAWVNYYRLWDFVAAGDALNNAIRLDPNYAPAHHLYSGVLQLSGRLDEAIAEEQQAVRADPLFLISRSSLADVLSLAGQNDRAVEQIKQIFAIDPRFPKAHEELGTIYLRRGMYKEAISEYQTSERYGGSKSLELLAYAYAHAGDRKQASRILSELQAEDRKSSSGELSDQLAIVEIGLGNRDAALAWLEKEYQQHDGEGPWAAKVDPIFESLRSDPRFQELMGRVQFPR